MPIPRHLVPHQRCEKRVPAHRSRPRQESSNPAPCSQPKLQARCRLLEQVAGVEADDAVGTLAVNSVSALCRLQGSFDNLLRSVNEVEDERIKQVSIWRRMRICCTHSWRRLYSYLAHSRSGISIWGNITIAAYLSKY